MSTKQKILDDPDLQEALIDLSEVVKDAEDEDYPLPSALALENAERILKDLFKFSPQRYVVYPTMDGEVAVGTSETDSGGVLLLCDSDGGALCLVDTDSEDSIRQYSDAKQLPDEFVKDAISELEM